MAVRLPAAAAHRLPGLTGLIEAYTGGARRRPPVRALTDDTTNDITTAGMLRAPGFLWLSGALVLVLCGCSDSDPADTASSCAVEQVRQPLARGERVEAGHPSIVGLSFVDGLDCTGVALSETLLLTARHCLPAGADSARARIVAGPDASACPTGSCDAVAVQVSSHADLDVMLVRAARPLEQVAPNAWVGLNVKFDTFRFYAFGVGSYHEGNTHCPVGAGQYLLAADFAVERRDDFYLTSFTREKTAAVCDGDSGGPAMVELAGRDVVVGVLSNSTIDAKGEPCTPIGGSQTWVSTASLESWILQFDDGCTTVEKSGHLLVGCVSTDMDSR